MYTFKRYKSNLKTHNNKVYSYETNVADIDHKNRTIKPNDYYSMTTSKHINYVASEYGYKVIK